MNDRDGFGASLPSSSDARQILHRLILGPQTMEVLRPVDRLVRPGTLDQLCDFRGWLEESSMASSAAGYAGMLRSVCPGSAGRVIGSVALD